MEFVRRRAARSQLLCPGRGARKRRAGSSSSTRSGGALSTSAMRALFGLRRLVYPTLWDSDKKSPAEAGLSSIDQVCRGGGKPTSHHRPAPVGYCVESPTQHEAKPRRRIDGAATGLVA